MTRLIAKLCLALCLIATPALCRADDISNAERSIVRVVAVSHNRFGELVGFGHGTGFAISSSRILTSAHVIPANASARVSLFVVTPHSKTDAAARLSYMDRSKDLALLQIEGSLPALSIFSGTIPDGADVFALGYPGNVDLATSSSLGDYLAPKDPVRSQGHFANTRTVSGIDALLHTAPIARGNSGGPLLDGCGRVVGVNSFTTNSGDGDAPFGFAISNKALHQFLSAAGQAATKIASPCLSQAERVAAEQAKAAKDRERDHAARRAQEEAELLEREQMAAALQRDRENWIAAAILCGLLSVISFGAAGLLFAKERVRLAAGLVTIGLLLGISGAVIFISRPSLHDVPIRARDDQVVAHVSAPTDSTPEAESNKLVENQDTEAMANSSTPDEPRMSLENLVIEEPLLNDAASEDDPLWTQ